MDGFSLWLLLFFVVFFLVFHINPVTFNGLNSFLNFSLSLVLFITSCVCCTCFKNTEF